MTTHPTNTPAGQLSGISGELKSADLDALERLADAAIRGANEGWKIVPSTPTPDMAEALEACESYCDSCHGTCFSGWSGYDAMMKVAPDDFIDPSTIKALIAEVGEARGLLDHLSSASAKTINLAMSGRAARADIRDILAGPADAARAFLAKTDRQPLQEGGER